MNLWFKTKWATFIIEYLIKIIRNNAQLQYFCNCNSAWYFYRNCYVHFCAHYHWTKVAKLNELSSKFLDLHLAKLFETRSCRNAIGTIMQLTQSVIVQCPNSTLLAQCAISQALYYVHMFLKSSITWEMEILRSETLTHFVSI